MSAPRDMEGIVTRAILNPAWEEEVVPLLSAMRQERLEELAQVTSRGQEDFLRGQIAMLTLLTNLANEYKQQVSRKREREAERAKEELGRRTGRTGESVYIRTG